MSGHTPGPWYIGNEGYAHGSEFEIRADAQDFDWYITGVPWGDDVYDQSIPRFNEAEANARLISAAPELLDAAEDSLAAFRLLRVGLLKLAPETIEVIDAHIDELEFVLAKARGDAA